MSFSLARVFTKPDDLPESALAHALHAHWGITTASLAYQPVGFGSHHWLATDAIGQQLFATVDDLTAKLHSASDTAGAAFDRLSAAFGTALALRRKAGLTFVIAPVPTADGSVLARLTDRYSLALHPYMAGEPAGEDGEFARDADRRAVLAMLIQLHAARAGTPRTDDFAVSNLHSLLTILREPDEAWRTGPYAEGAQQLLRAHAGDVRTLVTAYRSLAGRVASRPDRMVITHGEPHAGNVIVTADGLLLADWDTTLLAPPERDLWGLAEDDESLLDRYAASTGVEMDQDALALYRLQFDLSEISQYLALFRSAHQDTADTRESWANLQQYLRPAERWPELMAQARDG